VDKEKTITIIIGLTAGLVLAGVYFGATKIIPNLRKPVETAIIQPASPKAEDTKGASITGVDISDPVDNSSITVSPVTVSGTTTPNATLLIFGNAEEKIASSDAKGNFSATLKLEEGENEISVTNLDPNNSSVAKRHVTLEINP